MPLFEVTKAGLNERTAERFASLGMYERADLQRLVRDNISAIGEDLLVISEEFGEWEDARRRIDLLAIDSTGRLVVIELKRTEAGGHMDLQALRYAAMVSSMGFDEVVRAFSQHCGQHRTDIEDPKAALLEFLQLTADDEPTIATDVRIILVSADFGREITTTVLWLNGYEGMDIRCVRLVPYEIDGRVLLDIQQVLPLPEAADYQVRLRRKEAARDRARTDGRDFTRYNIIVDGNVLPSENKRNAIRLMVESLADRGVPLAEIERLLPKRIRSVPGNHSDEDSLIAALTRSHPSIDIGRWFTQHPLFEESTDTTYVVSKMWGRQTEAALGTLATSFPHAGVSFQRAEDDED